MIVWNQKHGVGLRIKGRKIATCSLHVNCIALDN
jgi:hypothetical protein